MIDPSSSDAAAVVVDVVVVVCQMKLKGRFSGIKLIEATPLSVLRSFVGYETYFFIDSNYFFKMSQKC